MITCQALAATTGISKRRVAEVLDLVGLSEVADRRCGGFSLGMGQRLGIASALLGDPRTVMLDEPVNGLDPEGILWIRKLLKSLTDEGRTVLVSSHLMSEMVLTAEHFIIVGRGRLIANLAGSDLTAMTDPARAPNITLPRVIRSEWIRLQSVRSRIVTLGLTACAGISTGVLVSMLGDGAPITAEDETIYDPAGNSLFGATIAQLVLGVMGALVITSEYSTGLIRTTLTAVPRRLPVLRAKVIVPAAAAFATMVASLSVAFFVGQAVYSGGGPSASLSDPGVLRALLAAALFPTMIAVMGVAFGALMRHTATAIGILVATLFVLPTLFRTLGGVWGRASEYLPGEAGEAMITVVRESGDMSPGTALLVPIGWIGAPLAAGTIALKRRDA